MRYAISNWIYGSEPLLTTFQRLTRFGYDGLELVGEPSRYDPAEVSSRSREFGLPITSVLSWCIYGISGRDAADTDPSERAAATYYLRACVDFAAAVGAPILVILPAPAGRTVPHSHPQSESEWDSAYRAEWDSAVRVVREAAEYASRFGVMLALEPINRYESFLVNRVEQGLAFLQDVGSTNLGLHLDTFHMNLEEADQAAAIRLAGAKLVNMHVSDSNREAPGRGHTDFHSITSALVGIGYPGVLALEPVPPGSDPILAAAMSKHIPLRDVYAEEGIRHLRRIEQSVLANAPKESPRD